MEGLWSFLSIGGEHVSSLALTEVHIWVSKESGVLLLVGVLVLAAVGRVAVSLSRTVGLLTRG